MNDSNQKAGNSQTSSADVNPWQIFAGTSASWHQIASELAGYNPHHTYEWGLKRNQNGGEVLRLVYDAGKGIQAACQCFLKRLPLRNGIILIQGGPLGDTAVWDQSLFNAIAAAFELAGYYIRCGAPREREGIDVINMYHNGWQPAWQRLGSRMSMTLALNSTDDGIAGPSSNWRHNLKRGYKKSPHLEKLHNPQAQDLIGIYREMESYKGIENPIPEHELAATLEHLKDKMIFYRTINDQGQTIAFRACVISGKSAWDFLAATTKEARKTYASYVLLNSLVKECAANGVASYDLGGIDPSSGAGVYNFKKGTGAKPIEYLGEWEVASSQLLKFAANLLVFGRKLRSRF